MRKRQLGSCSGVVLTILSSVFITVAYSDLEAVEFRVERLSDIRPSDQFGTSWGTHELQGQLFFFGSDNGEGGLYKTDGDSVTLVGNIPHQVQGGSFFDDVGGQLVFRAVGETGEELFRTDGNSLEILADVYPGHESSRPRAIDKVNGSLLFVATGVDGRKLYRTDGNIVEKVGDISPGEDDFSRAFPVPSITHHDKVLLGGNGDLLETDGFELSRIAETAPGGFGDFTAFRGDVYFFDNGLQRFDGSKVVAIGDVGEAIGPVEEIGDKLVFRSRVPEGIQLFAADQNGVVQLTNFSPQAIPLASGNLRVYNDELYFRARVDGYSLVLHRTDGNEVTALPDMGSGSLGLGAEVGSELYFGGTGDEGPGLYRMDEHSATFVDNIPATFLTEYMGELVFAGRGPDGTELYQSDGETVTLLADLYPGSGVLDHPVTGPFSSSPRLFREFNGELFFRARDADGEALYKLAVVPEPSSGILGVIAICVIVGVRPARRGRRNRR